MRTSEANTRWYVARYNRSKSSLTPGRYRVSGELFELAGPGSPVGDKLLQRVDEPGSRPVEVGGSIQDNDAGGADFVDVGLHQRGFLQRTVTGEAARRQDQQLRASGDHV